MKLRHVVVIGIYVCLCLKSTNGRHKRETGPCDPNPCQNDGTCTVHGTDYTCSCRKQFRGRDCESKRKCDAGWHIYGDKCFKFSSSTKTWEAAKNSCVNDYSGYLAEIYSESENNFLECTGKKISSLTSGVWFGLKWLKYMTTYIWVTSGTVLAYSNWLGGTGKGFSNVFCYKFDQSNGFWDQLDCSASSNYICEKEAADDPCFPNPCQNEGTCIANGADYTCYCQSGSKGKKCENVTGDPCTERPCKNGGTCTSQSGSYTCTCTSQFAGTNCELQSTINLTETCLVGTAYMIHTPYSKFDFTDK